MTASVTRAEPSAFFGNWRVERPRIAAGIGSRIEHGKHIVFLARCGR
jgi:hypothetical protein